MLLITLLVPIMAERFLSYSETAKTESASVYGDIDDYLYYFVDLEIGTPPQRTSVIIDTGSAIGAFPCSGCSHCGSHLDQAFNVQHSSSAVWITCKSSDCFSKSCDRDHCSYEQSYREGSKIQGWFFSDLVSLGDVTDKNPATRAEFGCHSLEEKMFYEQRANGIMGMAPRRDGKPPTFLDNLFHSPQISKSIFSLCLSPQGGELVVGGANSTRHSAEPVWTDMEIGQYYSIKPQSLSFGGVSLGTQFGTNSIVDSGTTFTYLPPSIYTGVIDQIKLKCNSGACSGSRPSGEKCWTAVEGFPSMTWKFVDGVEWVWPAKDGYMYFKKSSQLWCYAFEDSQFIETVFGASFFVNSDLIFDINAKKLGLAPANCPRVVTRPNLEPSTVSSTAAPPSLPPSLPSPVTPPVSTPVSTPISSPASTVTGSYFLLIGFFAIGGFVYAARKRRVVAPVESVRLTAMVGAPLENWSV